MRQKFPSLIILKLSFILVSISTTLYETELLCHPVSLEESR